MKDYCCFRGDRNYLQATTLMDYIVQHIIPDNYDYENLDFSMSKFTDKICETIPPSQGHCNDSAVIGQFQYGDQKILILETKEKITRRVEYNEKKIIDCCELIENKIIVVSGTLEGFSFIEKVVAAYKELLQQMFGKSYQDFFFIRIMIEKIPEGQVEISYNRLISKKYFQSTITHHGQKIGTLIFGAKQR